MTTGQLLNVTFDVWSVLFSIILMVGAIVSQRYNPPQARSVIGLAATNAFINISEVFAYLFRGDVSELGFYMVRISNFAVFFLNHVLLAFAAMFVIRTIERDGDHVGDTFKRSLMVLVSLGIVLLVLSRIFGFYYAFDDQNHYYRLSSYWIMPVLQWLGLVALLGLTLLNWKNLSPIERVAFIMLELLPIAAIVGQLFTYGISLTTLANTVSIAMVFVAYILECSRGIVAKERAMLDEVIRALAQAVDARDDYTIGHSRRVAQYSRMLMEKMGYSDDEAQRIYRTALLHDVGKIGVPDGILNKESKLTDEEFRQIKEHPAKGDKILEGIASMPELRVGARWHHERFDGRGYPDGLAAEDIPFEARVICVADSYDAMTSDRVYRKHLSQPVVRQEFVDNAGTQFDPTVAKAMLQIIDEDTNYELHG